MNGRRSIRRSFDPLTRMKFDRRLLALLHSHIPLLAVAILAGFAGGALAVEQARLLSQAAASVFLDGQGLAGASGLLGLLLAVMGARAVLVWVGEAAAADLAARIKVELRRRLIAHILALGPLYTRGERTGELTTTVVDGVDALDAYFSQYLPQVFLSVLVPLTFLVLVFPLDPISALILLVTAPLIPLFMVLIGSLAEALTRRQWLSLSRLSAHFLDVLQGLATLKALGRSRAQAQGIEHASEGYRRATLRVLRVTFLSALALELISTLSTAVVAVEIGLRLLYGRLTFEQAFFVLLLAPEFYLPLRTLGARFHAGMAGVGAAGRIFEILEMPLRAGEAVSGETLPWQPAANSQAGADSGGVHSMAGLIRFDKVSFAYPGGCHALKEVSFDLPPGRCTALVGPSGAGKSTVAALLLGFVRPDGGRILAGGASLDALTLHAWRRATWVPQSPFLFNTTVEGNIHLGKPGASRAEVVHAARLASADEFIQGLPQGYDTPLGERGARLSGGQAQRIALARAFLVDAPLLILDEATANLDPVLEDQVQAAIGRLASGRTVLIIAHRLNTVARADQIVVLDQGRVVQVGTYPELSARKGLFRELVEERSGVDVARAVSLPASIDGPPQNRPAPAPTVAAAAASSNERPSPRRKAPSPLAQLLVLVSPFGWLVALSVLLGFATVGSSIGLMSTSAYIIARAALQPSIAELQVAIVGVRFFGLARGLFRYLERYVSHQVTFRLLTRLRVRFYTALEPLAPAHLLRYGSGDLLSRAVGDIAALENFYVRALAPPLVAMLVGAVMFVFMAAYDLRLAFSLAGMLLLAGLGLPLLARFLGRAPGRRLAAQRATLSGALVDGIQGLADLAAFGQGLRQLEVITQATRAVASTQRSLARLSGLTNALGGLLANLGLWVILVESIPLVRAGRIDGVSLAVLTLAALTSFEAVLPLPFAAQHLTGSLEASRRLFELVEAEPEVRDPDQPLPAPAIQPAFNLARSAGEVQAFDLEARRLSFRYPDETGLRPELIPALEQVSFTLPLGKRLAVVGPSGAGKSTLAQLLLRFWEFQDGELLLGGQDLRSYRAEDVRRAIAVVAQSTHLFNASVRENLLLARPRATEAELIRAAQDAQIHEFILSLPQGYDTWIGEAGLRMSGGERQRLALARALLRAAPILLLDEPTANLDPITEQKVLRTILEQARERSVLLITHRLVGLEAMDEILVLRAGRVAEHGTQDELLERDSFYRRMWSLQHQTLEETL